MLKQAKPKILFLFPKPVKRDLELIKNGQAPAERLYGMLELAEAGYIVNSNDAFFSSRLSLFYQLLRRFGIYIVPPSTIISIAKCDIVVAKNNFSILLSLITKLFGKKLIYKDSLFKLPSTQPRRFSTAINLLLCDKVLGYSQSQLALWKKAFPRAADKFAFIPYPIDIQFYKLKESAYAQPSVVSAGRDMGRDYTTLFLACQGLGIKLHLVTLPYLLPKIPQKADNVTIYENISYDQLFRLYGDSMLVVVPLKERLTYPSGIRAVMEAAALGVPCICTDTPVLREYFDNNIDVLYCPPGDVTALKDKINLLTKDQTLRNKLASNAKAKVEKYSIQYYGLNLIQLIES